MAVNDLQPIIGAVPRKDDMKKLREAKKELASQGYPIQQTAALADQLYEKAEKQWKKIPPGTAMVVMGSTTGKNIIPYMLSNRLKEQDPTLKIYNTQEEYVAVPIHQGAGKNKSNYQDRINDPRSYKIIPGPKLEQLKNEKTVVILDDVISTGESAIVLKKQLQAAGVNVKAIAASLTSSRSFASEKDMSRLTELLMKDKPKQVSVQQLESDVRANFKDFPRRKIFGFHTNLNRSSLKDVSLRYATLAQGAAYYRSLDKPPALRVDYKALLRERVKQQANGFKRAQAQQISKSHQVN